MNTKKALNKGKEQTMNNEYLEIKSYLTQLGNKGQVIIDNLKVFSLQ